VSPAGLPGPRIAPRPTAAATSGRVREIVAAGRSLLESEGADALTMRRVGDLVGIRAASLYKHLPGKPALEAALVDAALFEVGDESHRVLDGAGGAQAVGALLATYRRYALGHPNLYRLATSGRIDRDLLTPGLEQWSGEPFYRATGDPWVGQALWAAAHGAVVLEIDRAFSDTSNLDATWAALARAFTTSG
jgi:AcrR family transcriptional regulator